MIKNILPIIIGIVVILAIGIPLPLIRTSIQKKHLAVNILKIKAIVSKILIALNVWQIVSFLENFLIVEISIIHFQKIRHAQRWILALDHEINAFVMSN